MGLCVKLNATGIYTFLLYFQAIISQHQKTPSLCNNIRYKQFEQRWVLSAVLLIAMLYTPSTITTNTSNIIPLLQLKAGIQYQSEDQHRTEQRRTKFIVVLDSLTQSDRTASPHVDTDGVEEEESSNDSQASRSEE